ncbi:MAG: hypothetical protein OEO20_14455 [Gemmatimonadota bacterium]|nr:hypothetical protein [Gemmatimonadota bacterium]MDH3479495.1 hypothetical protein [Gemmatimonadota bacterium]MDH3569172.1 hypothetical protein [Gemmatimonadota bacterium]
MRWPGFLLLPLLFVACTDTQPLAPIEDGPSFDWMNNPDNGNVNIFRISHHWRICWTDPSNMLRVCHTTIPSAANPQTACDIQGEGDPVSHQDVGLWIDEMTSFLHAVHQGETFVVIRDMTTDGDCFGKALVAEGWGRLTNTDNDILGSTDPNTNTWSFRGQGRLEATDGRQVHYNGVRHMQFGPNIEFRVLKSKVNLR